MIDHKVLKKRSVDEPSVDKLSVDKCSVDKLSVDRQEKDWRLSLESISVIREDETVLDNVSLDLSAGQLIALVGPNGAGKTTLLNCASGTMQCDQGRVFFNGKNMQSIAAKTRAQQLAVLPQQSSLNFPFLVKDVIALGRYPHDSGYVVDAAIIKQLMTILHIDNLAERSYTALSGGEQQRVQIARVLSQLVVNEQLDVYEGSVLLLDEPVAALDMPHQSLLMTLLQSLAANGLTVLLVLHDLNLVAAYVDKVAMLKAGRLMAFDSVDKVMTESLIEQVYDVKVDIMPHPKTARPLIIR